MTEETKLILERLDVMSQDIKETKQIAQEAKQIAMEARDAAREAKQIAVEAREAATEAKVMAFEALQNSKELKGSVDELQIKVIKIQTIIETDVCQKINVVGEGHDFLKMSLDRALSMEKERERMWLEIISLRYDMKRVKEKIGVA